MHVSVKFPFLGLMTLTSFELAPSWIHLRRTSHQPQKPEQGDTSGSGNLSCSPTDGCNAVRLLSGALHAAGNGRNWVES